MSNVYSSPNNANVYAGWGLVVIYQLASEPIRNLVAFDGFGMISNGNPLTISVSGFVTPPAGTVNTRLGVLVHEGDIGYTGDQFRLNGNPIGDALNPTTNFFNSSITRYGSRVTTKNPDYVNQLGFDIDQLILVNALANNATSATIQCTSSGDTYYPGVIVFGTDLYAPVIDGNSFTKTVTDVNGGSAQPGDVLEYRLTMRNVGQDDAVQTVMRDTLPANATYVPGSMVVVSGANAGAKTDATDGDQAEYLGATRTVVMRVGTGANGTQGGRINVGDSTVVRFRVQVNVPTPNGSQVVNQAATVYTGAQSGVGLAGRSDGDPATGGAQGTAIKIVAPTVSGTVFEDVNYGGGAGRSRFASAGVPLANVRVEFYAASGTLLGADTTDATGAWAFDGWTPGTYTVRVAESTVRSSRAGSGPSLLPVLTFRAPATTGAAVADPDRVGGEVPRLAEAPANLTAATLASLTTATQAPQSIATVTLGAADIPGVDFGYNFDTIVNANDAGRGSLRQFLANAAALSDAGLAQAGLPSGVESSVFMVSDGLAHPGLRAGLTNLLTGGVVRIGVASALPALSASGTRLDGSTQTRNVGNTNPGLYGTGGVVGADDLSLPAVPGPEVELDDGAGLAIGLDVTASSVTLRGLALTGFGNSPGSNSDADVRVAAAAANVRLEGCVLGATALAWADPGAALRSGGDHLRALGGDGGTLDSVLVGFGAGAGVALTAGSDGWQLVRSEFRGNGSGAGARAGVSVEASRSARVALALVTDQNGIGIDAASATGACLFDSLSARRSGLAGGTAGNAGVRAGGSGTRIERSALESNLGSGVLVPAATGGVTITRNRMQANGALGIDLLTAFDDPARGSSPFVTLNDNGDTDSGGNTLLNFPILQSATIASGQFTVQGWARPGATIEVFVAAASPSGFGEGRTWAATFVEGSGSDLDTGSSSYSGTINGLNQGADATNRFRFTVATPAGIAPGVSLTATATLTGSGTSEFSGLCAVGGGVQVSGWVYADADHDATRDPAEAGTALAQWVKLVPASATSAAQVVAVNPATGAWSLTSVATGTYTLVLDDNGNAADIAPAVPSGWIATESPGGVRALTVASIAVTDQNFGLFHGARVRGVVFRDDGAGGAVANDGARQGTEAALAAVRMALLGAACTGGRCDSTLTAVDGTFALWVPQVAVGAQVRVRETNPAGERSTGGRAGSTGGAYDRTLDEVVWTAVGGASDSLLAFGDVPLNAWGTNGALGVTPGGAVDYAHRFVAGTAGVLSVGVLESPAPPLPGWTLSLFRDLDCDGTLDPGEPALSGTVALTAGQQVCVIARHASPAGAPPGAYERATLTASFTLTGASPALAASDSLFDVTTVTAGSVLRLDKTASVATVAPGGSITYTVTYTNPGPDPVSNIVIRDATPAWTVFTSATCLTLGAGLASCTLTTQPAVNATGSVVWTLGGALAPGASGSVQFRVRVP